MNKSRLITFIFAILFLAAGLCFLNGCQALQPYAHADAEGYEAGVRGTWNDASESVESMLNRTPTAPRNGSFKEIVK